MNQIRPLKFSRELHSNVISLVIGLLVLASGFNFITKAFEPFGDIEDAAIAPQNHGFGKRGCVQRSMYINKDAMH